MGELRTITGFLLAPRGLDRFDEETKRRVLDDVESRVARHVPEFPGAVRYRALLDPAGYEALHGLSPALSHAIPTQELDLLPVEDPEPGLYRMGNGVGPPGEHANAAMVSALWAAEHALKFLSTRPATPSP